MIHKMLSQFIVKVSSVVDYFPLCTIYKLNNKTKIK